MLSQLLRPRVCELGKIKIGGLGESRQKRDGSGTYMLPVKFDHFIITGLTRDQSGRLVQDTALIAELSKDYADPDGKLRQLPITLLSDDIDDVMQCSWVWYGGKKIFGRSDGKTVTWLGDPRTMKALDKPREEEWRDEFAELKAPNGAPLFKLHTIFNCVLASKESRWGGVYKLRTVSRITGEQLYGSLLHIRQLTNGILRGLPMRLVVRPMQVAPDGKPTTVYVVHCELRGKDLLAIQEQALKMAEMRVTQTRQIEEMNREYKRLLAAPGSDEDGDDPELIEAEFHSPDQPADTPPSSGRHSVFAKPNGKAATQPPAQQRPPSEPPQEQQDNIPDAEFEPSDGGAPSSDQSQGDDMELIRSDVVSDIKNRVEYASSQLDLKGVSNELATHKELLGEQLSKELQSMVNDRAKAFGSKAKR